VKEEHMPDLDLSHATWRKSVRSDAGQGCVEVARIPSVIGVRDSKDPASPELGFSLAIFRRFTDEIRNGRHDLNG
jgi:Domain of unknown function (DUF397)